MNENNNRIVLVRHAQSQWNLENRFTGWSDVGLTDQGREEARRAGRALREAGLAFDEAHASLLQRALDTFHIVAGELGATRLPVMQSWRLNERHYGALQGLSKLETAGIYGEEQVHRWRRGFADRPPALDYDDPRHPRFDPRYEGVCAEALPATESLADVLVRFLPYWSSTLEPLLRAGRRLLVVSHGNVLRALVKHLDDLSDAEIEHLDIPTGVPLVYEFDGAGRRLERYYLDPAGDGVAATAA